MPSRWPSSPAAPPRSRAPRYRHLRPVGHAHHPSRAGNDQRRHPDAGRRGAEPAGERLPPGHHRCLDLPRRRPPDLLPVRRGHRQPRGRGGRDELHHHHGPLVLRRRTRRRVTHGQGNRRGHRRLHHRRLQRHRQRQPALARLPRPAAPGPVRRPAPRRGQRGHRRQPRGHRQPVRAAGHRGRDPVLPRRPDPAGREGRHRAGGHQRHQQHRHPHHRRPDHRRLPDHDRPGAPGRCPDHRRDDPAGLLADRRQGRHPRPGQRLDPDQRRVRRGDRLRRGAPGPGQPGAAAPAYDSGDHVHPNSAGMQAMANTVNLALLTS